MPGPLDRIGCASLPLHALAALADLRRERSIVVTEAGGRAWVRWEPATDAVLRRVLPLPGVELYERRDDGLWYRHGARLPTFGLPVESDLDARSLLGAVTPRPVEPIEPDEEPPAPATLVLARDDRARPVSAWRGALALLGRWAESAPTARLEALRAACAGSDVLVLGRALPMFAGGVRFWGDRVLVPLGFRPEPNLPDAALRAAFEAGDDALLVLDTGGFERVPLAPFRPLSRASVRLAAGAGERPT